LFNLPSGPDASLTAIDVLTFRDCDLTGFAGLVFNGRPTAKLPLVYADNNTLRTATLITAGANVPLSIINGQFNLDRTGASLVPFAMIDATDIFPSSVPATVNWLQLSTPNFAAAYAQLWKLNLSGSSSIQARLSLNAGNNSAGGVFGAQADVMSWFTGGCVIIGPGTVDCGPGNLSVSGTIVQDAWIAPSLQNSWTNLAGANATAVYNKDKEGWVHLRGLIAPGTTTALTTLLTLPSGYRPPKLETFRVDSSLSGGMGIAVDASGNVNIQSSAAGATYLSLSGIAFRTD
jgi:hypothetical protein